MAEKRIAVNATCVRTEGTGLHVVSTGITKELVRKAGERMVIYSLFEDLNLPDNVRVERASRGLSPEKRTIGHILRIIWLQLNLPFRLKKDHADVIYSPVDEGMMWGLLPQAITCHDTLPLIYPEIHPKRKYYYYYLMPLVLRACEALICVSENTMKDIRREYRLEDKPMHVVYSGIDHETFQPKKSNYAFEKHGLGRFVLYVGDMRPYKNLERTVEAFERANLPEHKLVIVGKKDDKFYPQLKKRVEDMKLEDRVVFTDYLPTEKLPDMYSAADAFVFPSLYEGFGIPPLEAMACGCPVVTSRVASIPEACGDAAYYVDPYNVDSIAEGISKVVKEPLLSKKLVEKGPQRARMFTWSKSADKVLGILDEISR